MNKKPYEYMDDVEIDDDFDFNSLTINDEELENDIKVKKETFNKVIERAFYIWLYPNHQLKMSEVKEILKPYLSNDEKSVWISEKYGKFLQECIQIRGEYNEEQKNLKAQINK